MSLMMVFSPVTMSAVDWVSWAVSSRLPVWGTGDFRSPATSSFIRSHTARMGLLMLVDKRRATAMEARAEAALTRMLMRMPTYVSVR